MQITRPVPDARRYGSAARQQRIEAKVLPLTRSISCSSLNVSSRPLILVEALLTSTSSRPNVSDAAAIALLQRADALGLDLHLGVGQCCFVAATDSYVGSLTGEAQRNCLADASIAASDEDSLSIQLQIDGSFSRLKF